MWQQHERAVSSGGRRAASSVARPQRRLGVAPLDAPSLLHRDYRHARVAVRLPEAHRAAPWARALGRGLRRWGYRLVLLAATIALVGMLARVQSLSREPAGFAGLVWARAFRWLELVWLLPLPLALAQWLGWWIFAEAARPQHAHGRAAPLMRPCPGDLRCWPVRARLVFRICTRGDNPAVLRDTVAAIHTAIAAYGPGAGPYAIEVVSETAVNLDGQARVSIVPRGYVTRRASRFKARALTYLQAISTPGSADWHIYLDEESRVDAACIAGIYAFIRRANAGARRMRRSSARLIGQGAILYQGGRALFRGADALRTGDDLGRFRLQYALGVPAFGVHGSYLIVRGIEERALSFDVGRANSVTEDAAWALRAWARGWRFGWVRGYLGEQPPQSVMDFVRQRARWLSGIRVVACDGAVPLRFRFTLLLFVALWQISFLPVLVSIAALLLRIPPVGWERLPADFAWATFVLSYMHGLGAQAVRSRPHSSAPGIQPGVPAPRDWLRCQLGRAAEVPLVLGLLWYALLEMAGVLYSLRPGQGFFVIRKPSLAHNHAT